MEFPELIYNRFVTKVTEIHNLFKKVFSEETHNLILKFLCEFLCLVVKQKMAESLCDHTYVSAENFFHRFDFKSVDEDEEQKNFLSESSLKEVVNTDSRNMTYLFNEYQTFLMELKLCSADYDELSQCIDQLLLLDKLYFFRMYYLQ